jgi:hypothetical protein
MANGNNRDRWGAFTSGDGWSTLAGGDRDRRGGCYVSSTPILMASGKEKIISEIQPGEWIACLDSEGHLSRAKVKDIIEGFDNIWNVNFGDNIFITKNHKVLTFTGVKRVDQLIAEVDKLRTVGTDGKLNWSVVNEVDVVSRYLYSVCNIRTYTTSSTTATVIAKGIVAYNYTYFRQLREFINRRL